MRRRPIRALRTYWKIRRFERGVRKTSTYGAPIPVPGIVKVEFNREGELGSLPDFLVSTSSGLLLCRDGSFRRMFDGPGYGVAPDGGDGCLAVQTGSDARHRRYDRIVRVHYDSGRAEIIVPFLRYMVHQIDLLGDRIAVTECYHNAIKLCSKAGKILEVHYPSGRLGWEMGKGGKPANYRHFNSIFANDQGIFIFAHNKATDAKGSEVVTGRRSEIYVLGHDWRTTDVISLDAMNGHNVAFIDGIMYHCDSMNKRSLVVGDRSVFSDRRYYIRGLAVKGDHVLVGGSGIAEREVRHKGDGHVFVLDRDFSRVGSFELTGVGQVYDIRFLTDDLCTSNHATRSL